MNQSEEIKKTVREKYSQIAAGPKSSCCGAGNQGDCSVMEEDYAGLHGYVKEADLGLGCGIPTEFAGIKKGDVVVDLGSGAGNDVFVARASVGEEGKVIGIDFTEQMIDKANLNKEKLGYENAEFKLGEIENIPLEENSVNVVLSNCVLNLVPDKNKAFSEIYRILKKGGHFCISDIVTKGSLPEKMQKSAEMYVGCVAGAIKQAEYLQIISDIGFTDIKINKTKKKNIPKETLELYLTEAELQDFENGVTGIFSITVSAVK
jgi:ubiquinone/menaquinone biosynthesis C-methylase UbiE